MMLTAILIGYLLWGFIQTAVVDIRTDGRFNAAEVTVSVIFWPILAVIGVFAALWTMVRYLVALVIESAK